MVDGVTGCSGVNECCTGDLAKFKNVLNVLGEV